MAPSIAPAPALSCLSCPACLGGTLDHTEAALRCARCDRAYPIFGGIPCLVDDPGLWRSLWMSRWVDFLSVTEQYVRGWHVEANLPDILPRTRARLLKNIAGVEDQRVRIDALFGDITRGLSQAIPPRPEGGQIPAVLNCYEHIFRDWVWGDKESEATLALVGALVGTRSDHVREPLGRLGVFGAGAGRLAVDVHRMFGPIETVALDHNPLPLLVAERLIRGEIVELPEFPVAPHSEEDVVVARRIEAPAHARVRDRPPDDALGPNPRGFSFVFADALRPPFAAGSLDSVLTPWFVDVVGADLRETAAVINRVLRPGGRWINLGPLRFKEVISRSYMVEEVWEIVSLGGFDIVARERRDLPYFDSPVSGSRRWETVFGFVATKTSEAPPVAVPNAVAPWLADTSLPIPVTPTLTGLGRTTLFTAGALSLVDGVRSMSDVAGEIARSAGMDAAAILDQLRAFFAKLPRG
jgi:N2227-like protein